MIIDNFIQAKKYLPAIVIKADISTLDDMFNQSEEELTDDILGEDLYQRLEQKAEGDSRLITMCERIISLNGFLRAMPDLDLVLTQSGFAVHNSEAMAPASSARVKALALALSERADMATDALIKKLITSQEYDDTWRGSEQFEKITAGFISSYTEFKEFAPYTPTVAGNYPKSYSEFKRLYPNLNVALHTEVASYLSEDFCSELIEKYRDREPFISHEKYIISLIKYALCSIVLGDLPMGRQHILKARAYLFKNPEHFPTFINSPEGQAIDNTTNDGPIFSML